MCSTRTIRCWINLRPSCVWSKHADPPGGSARRFSVATQNVTAEEMRLLPPAAVADQGEKTIISLGTLQCAMTKPEWCAALATPPPMDEQR